MVFNLGIPHKISDTPTFFGFYKDDGFEKRKNLGRIDKKGKWHKIEGIWLELYNKRMAKPGLSAVAKVNEVDEWLCESFMETDYSRLSEQNFKRTLQNYFAYLVSNGYNFYERLHHNKKLEIPQLDIANWKEFVVGSIFDCCTTETMIETTQGDSPYVTRSALNNGVSGFVSDGGYELNAENCITIGAEGAVAFYQSHPFVAGVKIYTLRNHNMNPLIAIFLCTVLNQESYKYSYGRARILDKIKNETIKLPAAINNRGEYQPDWQYMENYIKTLPYADLI
jgi:hypothetical protein